MKKALLLLLFSFQYLLAQETPTLDYYLPKDVTYNKDIPTPEKSWAIRLVNGMLPTINS